jgi:hypothetical protein
MTAELFGIPYTEWVGYLASLSVLISFAMSNLRKLRWVNALGSLLFIIYGVLLPSIPVVITNTAILFIHLYYLLVRKS